MRPIPEPYRDERDFDEEMISLACEGNDGTDTYILRHACDTESEGWNRVSISATDGTVFVSLGPFSRKNVRDLARFLWEYQKKLEG